MREMVHYNLIAEFVTDSPEEAIKYERAAEGKDVRVLIDDPRHSQAEKDRLRIRYSEAGGAVGDLTDNHRLVTVMASGRRPDSAEFQTAVQLIQRAGA